MNLSYRIAFSCSMLLFAASLFAQDNHSGTIKGSVVDESTRQPVRLVNVAVQNKSDTTLVSGNTSDSTGAFAIPNLPDGKYFVKFSRLGYKEKKTSSLVIDSKHQLLDLGENKLVPTVVTLKDVLVTTEKPLYNVSIDRKTYSVGKDLLSQSGSASELLQNVPSVQVDIDGNVSLRGSTEVLIMIDGKTSPLMKKNSATVLEQLPAGSIDKVEVITNASAKFKADGSVGIINIVLKKSSTAGFNGTLTGNGGNIGRYNGNGLVNYNPGPFNVYASYGYRKDHRYRTSSDNRLQVASDSTLTYYNQMTNSSARPTTNSVTLGGDSHLDKHNQIGFSGSYFYNSFTRPELADNLLYDSSRTLINRYQRLRDNYEFEKETNATAYVEHTFQKEDHTLRIDYTYSDAPEHEENNYTNTYILPSAPNEYDHTLIKSGEINKELAVEYSNPLSDNATFEAGYSLETFNDDFDYSADHFDTARQANVIDTAKTNRFHYDESINSLYATFKQSFGAFGFLAGLRSESVSYKSYLYTLDSTLSSSYTNLFPSLHLSYKLSDPTELQLSYSRRTRRPESEDLNPFPEYRDPRNIRKGNPKLLPEYVNSLEFGLQYEKGSVSFVPALFYRYTENKFSTFTEAVNDTLLITTETNLNNDQAGGVELSLSFNPLAFITLHGNASAYLDQIEANDFGTAKKSVTTWASNLIADFNFSDKTRLQLSSNYRSARLTAQGKFSPSYGLNFGFREELLENRLSLVATVTDVLKTMKREYLLDSPALDETTVDKRDSQVIFVGLTYHFGVQSKKMKEDQLHYDEN